MNVIDQTGEVKMVFKECETVIVALADTFPSTLTYYGKGVCSLRCSDGLSQILYFIQHDGTIRAELPTMVLTERNHYERVKRHFSPEMGDNAPGLREQVIAFMFGTLLEYNTGYYPAPSAS